MRLQNKTQSYEAIDSLQLPLSLRKFWDINYLIYYNEKSNNHHQVEDLASGKMLIKLKSKVEMDSYGQLLLYKEKNNSLHSSLKNSSMWLKKLRNSSQTRKMYETDYSPDAEEEGLNDDINLDKKLRLSSSNYDEDEIYKKSEDDEEDDDLYYDLDDENMYLEDEDLLYKRMMEEMEQEMHQEMMERMLEDDANEKCQSAVNHILFNNLLNSQDNHSQKSGSKKSKNSNTLGSSGNYQKEENEEEDGWITDDEEDLEDDDEKDDIFADSQKEVAKKTHYTNFKVVPVVAEDQAIKVC